MTQERALFSLPDQQQASRGDPPENSEPANRLRATMAAVRLKIRWLGTQKTLTSEQKRQAADSFGASDKFLSARKKLLDTQAPCYRAVTSIRTQAVNYWTGMTLPYPENGLRLIRQDDISTFHNRMQHFQEMLQESVLELDANYASLRAAARDRLGELFDTADYPDSLTETFSLNWDFPNVHPPDYLLELSPKVYQQEQQRIAQQFQEAVQLAEQAFITEFGNLVSHLIERLTGETDGKPKVFRDSVITNLHEFFDRFQHLNINSHADLDRLVDEARNIVQGIEPQQLRDQQTLRDQVAGQLSERLSENS